MYRPAHENLSTWTNYWPHLLTKKSNASSGIIKLFVSQKLNVNIVLSMQRVHLLEVLFYNAFKTLSNMKL